MIAYLAGTVISVRADALTLLSGAVGRRVHLPASQLAELRTGQETQLHTSLVVREDSMTLYGFLDEESRELFDTLLTVSGIGPRMALAVLSVLDADALHQAVAEADLTALQRVPGVGRKSAQRLVLELGGKLGAIRALTAEPSASVPAGVASSVIEALTGLGWTEARAVEAVEDARSELGEASMQDLLRASLQRMSRGA